MYETLLTHQGALLLTDLEDYARRLELDVERFADELYRHEHAVRISEDVASADESGVTGTPTFFVNGRRHYGAYDITTLTATVRTAKNRARLAAVVAGAAAPS
jgi:protein-disulfide isomerase